MVGTSRLVNRNITAASGRTSMRLEPEVWDALREICLREGVDLRDLMMTVERDAQGGGRTSAVRVHVLRYYREAATEAGHIAVGHGTANATGPLHFSSEIAIDTLGDAIDLDDGHTHVPLAPSTMQAGLDAQLADAS